MKNSLDKNAKWLLLFGILLTFLFPLLLPLLNKTGIGNFGVVGDAIGGITNPISQLIGSILLYLALKAQLSANGIVQNQIEKDGKSFVVTDDIEYGYLNVIPLWAFGLNY